VKTIHHPINVTSTEAELFAIRCSINQATQLQGLNKIIIVTDSIHSAKKIFDYSSHSHQVYSAAISCELREFFSINNTSIIEFWESLSRCKWFLFTVRSILKPENTSKIHLSCGELHGTSAKRESATVSLTNGK